MQACIDFRMMFGRLGDAKQAIDFRQQTCEGTDWPRHRQIGEAIAALQSIL